MKTFIYLFTFFKHLSQYKIMYWKYSPAYSDYETKSLDKPFSQTNANPTLISAGL